MSDPYMKDLQSSSRVHPRSSFERKKLVVVISVNAELLLFT